MNTSIVDLKTKGFVMLAYPPALRTAVVRATESWKKFCALSIETKKGLPYSNSADGVGYELKDGVGNKADRKENFDVTTAGQAWLETQIGNIKNQTALEFVKNATTLVGILKPIVLEFAQEAEQAFGLEGFVDEVASGDDAFFVRFIHYFGDREVGEETATAHTDQSGFTLHLFESAPGLQCKEYNSEWIDMPVGEGETVIIPAMQMQLRSKGELRALCHRVIATPETARDGRYSAVCFVQLKKTPKYDKERCGRLQEKEPGFNYGLSEEEFIGFFKK